MRERNGEDRGAGRWAKVRKEGGRLLFAAVVLWVRVVWPCGGSATPLLLLVAAAGCAAAL